MNRRLILMAMLFTGLSSCLIRAQDDETKLMTENPDWHITSEVFTDPPYWLMPTNAPYTLYPLSNGKWVWTTNLKANWYGPDGVDIKIDDAKARQVGLEQARRMDETDPPGIAHVFGYNSRGWNLKHEWNTNMAENWRGVWVEATNTGWRVNLRLFPTNTLEAKVITVHVGSIITNSGVGLLPSPDGKYAKLELLDSNVKVVPTKPGAALKLYEYGGTNISRPHPMPSLRDASVETHYPATLSDTEYPRWNGNNRFQAGRFIKFVGFVSNGPPCQIGSIIFTNLFDIKSAGDYTLTVQPVLYRMHYEGGTFQGYLDRVDLPAVTTSVHLTPAVK